MRRHGACVALLAIGLSVATATAQVSAAPVAATVAAVEQITIPVRDLEASLRFYTDVLAFQMVAKQEREGADEEQAQGLFGLHTSSALLQLGDERVELCEFLAPRGRSLPEDARSNDRSFQHIAIIVRDMDQAYAELRRHRVRHASPSPQTLPAWNPAAGGIRAFYFQDPDGHALEILWFPPGKGPVKWHAAGEALFLGIDHTAIVVADTEAGLRFWRDTVGLEVVGTSENHGPEQERLNNVFGARLRITTLRGRSGPGVELLEYLTPRTGRPMPADTAANDLWHWVVHVRVDDVATRWQALARRGGAVSAGVAVRDDVPAALVHDADGHRARLVGTTPAASAR